MHLLIAPPGSGKTSYLLEKTRAFAKDGKRIWWVGLPSQRSYVYRKLTETGAVLGVEFLSSQQVYYRLLAHALRLKPLVVGTGRLAMVGEALMQLRNELPSPGEARLFAQAIAEAKRFGLDFTNIGAKDEEMERLGKVFARYEQIKGEAWDYDDFRIETLKHAQRMTHKPEADVIMVDGFREIGPLELRIYKAIEKLCEVYVSLPEAPPGEEASQTLGFLATSKQSVFKASNPVSEARWVLRSVKRDLASGMNKLDLAIILPEREVKAFLALADEYGVPLMDETPKALADTLAGRLLLDLLELPDYPTASRLLAIPDLMHLANAALARGVAGLEAITVLAETLELQESWRKWLGLLEVPEDELKWAEQLLETSLPELRYDLLDDKLKWEQFKKHAMQRAKEASTLAKGQHFRKWWSALLQETFVFDSPRGGVALLTNKLASGRRFKKVYLMHAVEGAYSVNEGEDYFIPEEERQSLEKTFERLGLPKRYLGRDEGLYKELRTRGDEVIITYSEANQGGPLEVNIDLIGMNPKTVRYMPEVAAGSRLELETREAYRADLRPLFLNKISLQKLMRYDECAFRYWAEEHQHDTSDKPWWLNLLDGLRDYKKLNPARLEVLKAEYPEAAGWLSDHAEKLMSLNFGETLSADADSPFAFLDAAGRRGSEVHFYRFVAPGRVKEQTDAAKYIDNRWNELWAAGHMLERFAGRITKVSVWVWSVLAQPIEAYDGGITYVWRRIANRQDKIAQAFSRFKRGNLQPSPGFRCRECTVSDICRQGQR
ncbi:MAG: hypothetical protein KC422_08210 [Trueperaceae bacterium]|nr:hypothetical protein [Trueperaceae bacterium]